MLYPYDFSFVINFHKQRHKQFIHILKLLKTKILDSETTAQLLI